MIYSLVRQKYQKVYHTSPIEQRSKKICIPGPPCYIETNLIVNSLKEHGFSFTRAAMLKNRKTGNPMSLYMVNVLPRKHLKEIYQIKEIHYISDKIEAFNSNQLVKQCYRFQGFRHASEVCNFTPP